MMPAPGWQLRVLRDSVQRGWKTEQRAWGTESSRVTADLQGLLAVGRSL